MFTHRLQQQRFEIKFLLQARLVPALRECLRAQLELDEYGADQAGGEYPVHSLYLDTADLRLYHATVNGEKNRFKLRLRYYDERPEQPVFFEIKRRQNECILKQRAGVRRHCVPELLAGAWPEPRHLVKPDARQLVALQNFSRHTLELLARPRAHVAYRREAWVSPASDAVRVTFDRAIACETTSSPALSTRLLTPVEVFGSTVILEVKFTDRFPVWIGELVRQFGLIRSGAAKYVEGVSLARGRASALSTALALAYV